MRYLLILLALCPILTFTACDKVSQKGHSVATPQQSDAKEAQSTFNDIRVSTVGEFREAVRNLAPGDRILLADGEYTDTRILTFKAKGTAEHPIRIEPENPHQVVITGEMSWVIEGQHITFSGLDFIDCINVPTDKPYASIINSKDSSDTIRFSACRFIHCELELKENGKSKGRLITLHGDNHRFDHCFFYDLIGGTLAFKGPERLADRNEKGFARIDHNIFRDMRRQRALRDQGEAIFLGVGFEHYAHRRLGVIVEHNIFDQANGDHHGEIITIKSSENIFRNNLFVNAPDSHLSLRSTDNCRIYNNLFQNLANGMWVTGEGHHIYNNYFNDIKNAALLFQPGNIKSIVDNKGVIMIHDVYLDRKETPNFYKHISQTYGAAWRPAKNTIIVHNYFAGLHRHGMKAVDNPRSKVGNLPIENNLIANNIFEAAANDAGAELIRIDHPSLNTISNNIYVNPTHRNLGYSGAHAITVQHSPYKLNESLLPDLSKSESLETSAFFLDQPDALGQPRAEPSVSIGPIEIGMSGFGNKRVNLPPVPPMPGSLTSATLQADFKTFPNTIEAGSYLILDAAHSAGDIIEYHWEFGDGSRSTSKGNAIAHRWKASGEYLVTLRVKDRSGTLSTKESKIRVN